MLFNRFSAAVIRFTGPPVAFVIAFCVILRLGLLGPVL